MRSEDLATKVSNFDYADRHMPAVRAAIGSIPTRVFLDIETAPAEQDLHEATDLVIHVAGGDIAVRVRRLKKLWNDCPEWSVRVRARNGGQTEIHKLLAGYCRWYFTAYDDGNKGLSSWWLIDLDDVRNCGILREEWETNPNWDGSMGMYIPIEDLEKRGCIAFCAADTRL